MQTTGYVCTFSGERIHSFQNILKVDFNPKSLGEEEKRAGIQGPSSVASYQWGRKFYQLTRLCREDRFLFISYLCQVPSTHTNAKRMETKGGKRNLGANLHMELRTALSQGGLEPKQRYREVGGGICL